MTIQRFDVDATPGQLAQALRQDGVVIVERLFEADLADAVAREAEPVLAPQEAGGGAFFGHCTKFVSEPIVRLPSYRQMLVHPLLLGAGDEILGHTVKTGPSRQPACWRCRVKVPHSPCIGTT